MKPTNFTKALRAVGAAAKGVSKKKESKKEQK